MVIPEKVMHLYRYRWCK